jgi:glycosyltransferase involved in cell wall biosynthesis
MRILHINCNYIGTTLHQLMVERLDALGHDNQVYVPTYDRNIAVIQPNYNVIVSECFRRWDRLLFDYKQEKIFRDIQSKVTVSGYDCIHAYTLFTDGNCARRLSKKYGIPYIVAIRNTDVNDFFGKMVHLRSRGIRIMRDADTICFLSEAYRKQVFDKYVPDRYRESLMKKTCIIPNGIDDFWFRSRPETHRELPADGSVKLVYAGRIDKNKNIPAIQKAVSLLRETGCSATLTVVGKVQDKAEFARIQKDPHTTCLPAMPKEKLIDVYRGADIFVMPSFTESFGLVYAEAMSQGLPVVYTKGQGFDGQFPEGEVGFSVLPRDIPSIAEGIRKAMTAHSQISSRAAEKAGKFRWQTIVDTYDAIYRRIKDQ